MSKLTVYVAGPLTTGDWIQNVRAALDAESELIDAGYLPFVPHKSVLSDLVHHRGYEQWLDWCLAWVEQCDVLLRLPGESPGADREVEHAKLHGKPVVHGLRLDALAGCAKAQRVPPVGGPAKVVAGVLESVCKDVDGLKTAVAKLVLDKVDGNELDAINHEIRLLWAVVSQENRPGVPADPPVTGALSSSAQTGGDPSLGTIVAPDCLRDLVPAELREVE